MKIQKRISETLFTAEPHHTMRGQVATHLSMVAIAVLLIGSIMPLMAPPHAVQAAGVQLYMSSSASSVEKGATFTVSVRMNAAGEDINAVQADFSYSTSNLEFVAIGSASDFSLQPQSSGSGGTVSLTRGHFAPGLTGDKLVATVAFKALVDSGTTTLIFNSSSQALRNADSSDALTGTSGLTFSFVAPPVVDATPAPTPAPTPVAAKPGPSTAPAPAAVTPTPPAVAAPAPAVVAPPVITPTTPNANNNGDEKQSQSTQPAMASPDKTADDSRPVAEIVAVSLSGLLLLAAAVGGVIVFRRRVDSRTAMPAAATQDSGSATLHSAKDQPKIVSNASNESSDKAPRPPLVQG